MASSSSSSKGFKLGVPRNSPGVGGGVSASSGGEGRASLPAESGGVPRDGAVEPKVSPKGSAPFKLGKSLPRGDDSAAVSSGANSEDAGVVSVSGDSADVGVSLSGGSSQNNSPEEANSVSPKPAPLKFSPKFSKVSGGSAAGVVPPVEEQPAPGGVVSPVGVSPASVDAGVDAVDDSFNEFFGDLDEYGREISGEFSGDSFSGGGISVGAEAAAGDGSGEDLGDFDAQFAEFFGEDSYGDYGSDVVDVAPESLLDDDNFKKLRKRKVERDGNVEMRKKKAVRRAARRIKKNSGSTVYKAPSLGLETKKAMRGPREVLVDGEGEWRKHGSARSVEDFDKLDRLFNSLHGAAESGAEVSVSPEQEAAAENIDAGKLEIKGKVIYPIAPSSGGSSGADAPRRKARLNEKELSFYRSLQSSRSEVIDSQIVKEVLRMPTSGTGSTAVLKAQRSLAVPSGGSLRHTMGSGVKRVDFEILQFLAKFRYATHVHLSRLWGVQPNTAMLHLRKLRDKGLVDRVELWGTDPIWVITKAGMLLSGYDLPNVTAENMSYQLIPHQFTVNHIAANLWGGQLNVLDFEDWPVRNRVDVNGDVRFGEELVSETELHSSFNRVRGQSDASVFRALVKDLTDSAFEKWEAKGGAEAGIPSPEFDRGNEFMWILFPPAIVGSAFHFPDLVLKRPRNADGSPESIAIEIETVDSKGESRYMPALRAYDFDKTFYKKVIWVCKTNSSNKAITNASKQLDLWRDDRIEVVSITTDGGVFTGRDLWKL